MSRTQGVSIVVLLACLLAVLVHQTYLRKHRPARWEYRAAEGATIDVAWLQAAGADGWDCSALPAAADKHIYIMICKRYVP